VADIVTRSIRSRMMAGIGPRNTSPELVVRRYLHALGFRFRLHDRYLPGHPDLVFPKHGVVLFVHGCFWHQHPGCRDAAKPLSNAIFWRAKLAENCKRDARQISAVRGRGWRVGVYWECAARKGVADEAALRALARWLKQRSGYREFPATPARGRSRG
jgi:DNA mismatch endonuclease (patch repair protein)